MPKCQNSKIKTRQNTKWQNTKGQNTNATKYNCNKTQMEKIQIEQNAKIPKYKHAKIKEEQYNWYSNRKSMH